MLEDKPSGIAVSCEDGMMQIAGDLEFEHWEALQRFACEHEEWWGNDAGEWMFHPGPQGKAAFWVDPEETSPVTLATIAAHSRAVAARTPQ